MIKAWIQVVIKAWIQIVIKAWIQIEIKDCDKGLDTGSIVLICNV